MPARENGHEEPVIRDNRKIDPETGQVRQAPAAPQEVPGDVLEPQDGELAAQLAERTADLQRLQAEYTNYRRRVERDREAVRENAKVEVLGEFLAVLDDIGRAREHGDLTGAFRAVGEALEAATAKAGLVRYGEPGDEFDPTIHEALMHGYADDVEVATCTQVLQPGYRVGERIVRPARVSVAEPTEALPTPADSGDDN